MTTAANSARITDVLTQLIALIASEHAVPEVPTPRTPPERVLLTVEEASERLGIGKTKTYALVMSGEIESVLIGRLRRVHVDAITAYASRLVAQQNACPNAA